MFFFSPLVGFAPSPAAHLPLVQLPCAGRWLHPGPGGSAGSSAFGGELGAAGATLVPSTVALAFGVMLLLLPGDVTPQWSHLC